MLLILLVITGWNGPDGASESRRTVDVHQQRMEAVPGPVRPGHPFLGVANTSWI